MGEEHPPLPAQWGLSWDPLSSCTQALSHSKDPQDPLGSPHPQGSLAPQAAKGTNAAAGGAAG